MRRGQNPEAIVLCELFFCAHYTSPLFSNEGLYFSTTKKADAMVVVIITLLSRSSSWSNILWAEAISEHESFGRHCTSGSHQQKRFKKLQLWKLVWKNEHLVCYWKPLHYGFERTQKILENNVLSLWCFAISKIAISANRLRNTLKIMKSVGIFFFFLTYKCAAEP